MRRYFCDRCGGPIEDGEKYWLRKNVTVARYLFFSRDKEERFNETRHEICQHCQNEFWEWWEAGKRGTTK
ncbi:MAG: hypothetical protein IJ188_08225 [Clostridia bacterium]|nr:hypothetical protein [Clostridia bacterium]